MSGNTKVEYEGKIDEIVREENDLAIEISGSSEQSSIPIKLTLNITNSMKGKWILDTNSDYIGTDEDLYTNEIQSGKNVEIVMNEVKEYYIHVISISKYGRKEETIKGPIIIWKKYHKHTGSSTSGGGCYGNGTHTHRGCTQAANWGKRDPSTGRCNQCAREISGGSWTDCPYCAGGYYYTCGNKPINTYSINCGKSTTTLEGYSVSY